jgi:receptor protein-tyrosine kinase
MHVERQNANRTIGAILMDSGVLTAEGAEQIITLQKKENLRFGDAALRLRLVTEQDLQFALSRQFNYAYLPATGDRPVSEELIAAYDPFSLQVEQLRAIRSQLMIRWLSEEGGKALAVLSPSRREGRTNVKIGSLSSLFVLVFSAIGLGRPALVRADENDDRPPEKKVEKAAH